MKLPKYSVGIIVAVLVLFGLFGMARVYNWHGMGHGYSMHGYGDGNRSYRGFDQYVYNEYGMDSKYNLWRGHMMYNSGHMNDYMDDYKMNNGLMNRVGHHGA